MNKHILNFICVVFAILAISTRLLPMTASYAQEPMSRLRVDGEFVNTTLDIHPMVYEGYLFIPLRAVSEAIGFTVEWHSAPQNKVQITRGDIAILLRIGDDIILVNENEVKLSSSVQVVNGRTMIPACAIYDAISVLVEWDSANQIIDIFTEQGSHPTPSFNNWPVNSANWPEGLPQHIAGSIVLMPEEVYQSRFSMSRPVQFRHVFYSVPGEILDLVSGEELRDFFAGIGDESYEEMTLMRFVQHFNISRGDFDSAVDRIKMLHQMRGANLSDEMYELPNADIIFTFDNDIIRYFYRRE